MSFEDALAEVRPTLDPSKSRKELFVGNLDHRITECAPSVCIVPMLCAHIGLRCPNQVHGPESVQQVWEDRKA